MNDNMYDQLSDSKQIPIFVINLKRDVQKKQHMETLAKKLSLNFIFIEAVYGKDLTEDYIEARIDSQKTKEELKRDLSPGEIGCALSHMEIYQRIVDNNIEEAIVLEDDADIDKSFYEIIMAKNSMPKDRDIVLLGYFRHFPKNKYLRISFRERKQVVGSFKIVRFTEVMHSTIAYMITNKGAKKLLTVLKEGLYKPIDHYTGDDKYVNLYGIYPPCVKPHKEFQMHSAIMEERLQHDQTTQNTSAKRRSLFKRILENLNLLEYAQYINRHIGTWYREIKAIPKRIKKLKKYS